MKLLLKGPGGPGGPGMPGGPGTPLGPIGPIRPGSPFSPLKRRMQQKMHRTCISNLNLMRILCEILCSSFDIPDCIDFY